MNMKVGLLAIDPGYREFGFAHFSGTELLDCGVKSLRRVEEAGINVLSRTIARLHEEKTPAVLVFEKNNFSNMPQNKLVMKAIHIITNIARKNKLQIYAFAPSTIKKVVAADGRATKREISQVICARFPHLRPFKDTGKLWKDRYHQNMFDAIAVGLTYLKLTQEKTIQNYESDR